MARRGGAAAKNWAWLDACLCVRTILYGWQAPAAIDVLIAGCHACHLATAADVCNGCPLLAQVLAVVISRAAAGLRVEARLHLPRHPLVHPPLRPLCIRQRQQAVLQHWHAAHMATRKRLRHTKVCWPNAVCGTGATADMQRTTLVCRVYFCGHVKVMGRLFVLPQRRQALGNRRVWTGNGHPVIPGWRNGRMVGSAVYSGSKIIGCGQPTVRP
jgi:hypothetical protein